MINMDSFTPEELHRLHRLKDPYGIQKFLYDCHIITRTRRVVSQESSAREYSSLPRGSDLCSSRIVCQRLSSDNWFLRLRGTPSRTSRVPDWQLLGRNRKIEFEVADQSSQSGWRALVPSRPLRVLYKKEIRIQFFCSMCAQNQEIHATLSGP